MALTISEFFVVQAAVAILVASAAAAACLSYTTLHTEDDAARFEIEVELSVPLDELTSRSESYREAQLESLLIAGACYRQYRALDATQKVDFDCDPTRTLKGTSRNYWMESVVACEDNSQLRLRSKIGFPFEE